MYIYTIYTILCIVYVYYTIYVYILYIYIYNILKNKTQSSWPEYAVKIIPSDKINELQYRTSVIREMAVLQLLNHPGISRLISAFRYKDSAYMVLEYASKGDLHTYLINNGKLEHLQCRYYLYIVYTYIFILCLSIYNYYI